MIKQIKIVSIIVLFLYSNSVQSNQLQIKRINQKDGLSHNWVRCIYQDDIGYIWFGTSGALNRYNGYECKVFTIANASINAITKKDTNQLWICSDLGVYIFNIKTEKL